MRDRNEDNEEYMDSVLDENAWFLAIFPPTEPMQDVRHLELVPEEWSGRKGQAYQD